MSNITKRAFSFAYPCPRRLREIVKMSAFERESPETIKMLWSEYHKSRQHTTANVLSATLYREFIEKARASPFFVLPVPKKQDNSYFTLVS